MRPLKLYSMSVSSALPQSLANSGVGGYKLGLNSLRLLVEGSPHAFNVIKALKAIHHSLRNALFFFSDYI